MNIATNPSEKISEKDLSLGILLKAVKNGNFGSPVTITFILEQGVFSYKISAPNVPLTKLLQALTT